MQGWGAGVTLPLRGYPPETKLPQHDKRSRLIAYCAEEVRRQQDTPWHVWRMLDAWEFAEKHRHAPLDHIIVRTVARLVDEENERGYRDGPVWIGGNEKTHWGIRADMTALIEVQTTMKPADWYLAFETIHPFFDGNGRTGKVLYNWLRGSLDDPVWPPDFFGGIENP